MVVVTVASFYVIKHLKGLFLFSPHTKTYFVNKAYEFQMKTEIKDLRQSPHLSSQLILS